MRALALVLVVVLAFPVAAAETFHDFESLHEGVDKSFPLAITSKDVGVAHAFALRGAKQLKVTLPFVVEICTGDGKEVWWVNHTRGLATFPAIVAAGPPSLDRFPACGAFANETDQNGPLWPGAFVVWIRGQGSFQITDKLLERGENFSIRRNVQPPADTWVYQASVRYFVDFTGNVTVETYDFSNDAQRISSPATVTAESGLQFVYTISSATNASYGIDLRPDQAALPPAAQTPGPGVAAVLIGVAALAFLVRRR